MSPRPKTTAVWPDGPPPPLQMVIYIDDGHVFESSARDMHAARELTATMMIRGYCVFDDNGFIRYPPHRIAKIRIFGTNIDPADIGKEVGTRIH